MKNFTWVWLIAVASTLAVAKGPAKDAEQEALEETVKVLNSPAERQKIINQDPKAQKADAEVEAIVGSGAEKQRVYELSGKLMDKLMKKANGDPAKMMEILENAKRDPAAFAKEFSDEEKKMLKEIGASVEKSGRLKQNP
jgi:hypothetical protein